MIKQIKCPYCGQELEYDSDSGVSEITCKLCFKNIKLPAAKPITVQTTTVVNKNKQTEPGLYSQDNRSSVISSGSHNTKYKMGNIKSKGTWVVVLSCIGIIPAVFTFMSAVMMLGDERSVQLFSGIMLLSSFAMIICLIISSIIALVLLYNCWDVIKEGRSSTTPGKAVGFCFIPFFNLYWMYVAYVKLAKDMNMYIDDMSYSNVSCMPVALPLWWYILTLISIIPYISIFTFIPNIILFMIMMKKFANRAELINRCN